MKKALNEVRGKKVLLKMKHKLKKNLRARSRNKNLADMDAHFERLGLDVNKESLKTRVKKRKSISELENNKDKFARKMKAIEGGRDSDSGDDNEDMHDAKEERVGRKRQRSISSDDGYMDVDEESGVAKS